MVAVAQGSDPQPCPWPSYRPLLPSPAALPALMQSLGPVTPSHPMHCHPLVAWFAHQSGLRLESGDLAAGLWGSVCHLMCRDSSLTKEAGGQCLGLSWAVESSPAGQRGPADPQDAPGPLKCLLGVSPHLRRTFDLVPCCTGCLGTEL